MQRLSPGVWARKGIAMGLLFVCCLGLQLAAPAIAQSTFGAILGTVRDTNGALVQGAQVTLVNTGTTAVHSAVTDTNGGYAFKNIDVGAYKLTISASGFQTASLPEIALTARETRRADAALKIGGGIETVEVVDNLTPVITTEVSNLAETKVGDELVSLPVAIHSRSAGSTSPISTLTTEAGVQTDDSGNLAVHGGTAQRND
jgi:Carboxypeptidase regulatory-like domain